MSATSVLAGELEAWATSNETGGPDPAHLGCHLVQTANADHEQQLGLRGAVEAILGLGLALEAHQAQPDMQLCDEEPVGQ